MVIFFTILLIALILAIIVFIYGIRIYNQLVTLRTQVEGAWSDIDIQLKRRHDLIPNIVETIKGYASHERETLENVVKARSQAAGASDMKSKQAAENNLNSALSRLMVVVERYPELKASENFMKLQDELSKTESAIEKARRYYNGVVIELNTLISLFPSNIIAAMFRFHMWAFFKLDNESEREAPKVQF